MKIAVLTLLITCLSANLTLAAIGIEKTNVEATGVEVKGVADESHEIIVTIAKPEKPLEWQFGYRNGDFSVSVETSNDMTLEGGAKGKGFVITKTQATGKSVANVATEGEPVAGVFAVRPAAGCETKDGVFTFADVTLADGTKCAVSIRLTQKKV